MARCARLMIWAVNTATFLCLNSRAFSLLSHTASSGLARRPWSFPRKLIMMCDSAFSATIDTSDLRAPLERNSHSEVIEKRDWGLVTEFWRAAVKGEPGAALPRELEWKGGLGPAANEAINHKDSKEKRKTYFAKIAYFGPGFSGFQHQKGQDVKTVAGTIQQGIANSTANGAPLYTAGRTDKGVSAIAQVVHFVTWEEVDAAAVAAAINAQAVGGDLRVLELRRVPRKWHANFSAKWRRYIYLFPLNEGPIVTEGEQNGLEKGSVNNEEAPGQERPRTAEERPTPALGEEAAAAAAGEGAAGGGTSSTDSSKGGGGKGGGGGVDVDCGRVDRLLQRLEGKPLSYFALAYGKLRESQQGGTDICILHKARASLIDVPDTRMVLDSKGTNDKEEERHPTKKVMAIELIGDRFLRCMVRILVSTAVREAMISQEREQQQEQPPKAGCSYFDDAALENLTLMAKSAGRARAAMPAPPEGLCMAGVGYVEYTDFIINNNEEEQQPQHQGT